MPTDSPLGTFELMVLLAVLHQGEDGYGSSIRAQVAAWSEREVSRGAVYATLDRLEDKGLLSSHLGESTPERGGRAKRFYRVSAEGLEAVRFSRRTLRSAWDGVRGLLDEA